MRPANLFFVDHGELAQASEQAEKDGKILIVLNRTDDHAIIAMAEPVRAVPVFPAEPAEEGV